MEAFRKRIAGVLWQGGGPFIVWALHFFGLYVLVAAGCTAGWAELPLLGTSLLRVLLIATSLLAMAWITWLLLRAHRGLPPRGSRGLLAAAASGSAWLALVGVVWASAPALMLPMCSLK
ncbi:MAG: hypothetical protein H0W40_06145 [Methylibium sp.]|uniref:hypothetical protein n=1 Tax=Methylibium sp. TaxID=2067992 RepID=UPI00183C37AC|nr:hypothetical protein [Methylibium sp.]MBA3596943.1 hypothetical protein [Methylibium sp.]